VLDLVQGLATHDTGRMLGVLDELVDEGHDLLHFWSELVAATRDLLLLQAVPKRQDMLARPTEEADRLREAAKGLTREDLTRTFQILADLEPVLKTSSQPRFMFESTLIRLGSLGSVRPIEEVLDSLQSGAPQKKNAPEAPRAVSRPAPPPPRPAAKARTTPVPAAKAAIREKAAAQGESPAPPPAAPAAPATVPLASPAGSAAPEGGFSTQLIASVFEAKPMVGSILQEAVKIEVIGDALVIHLAKDMEALGRQLDRTENLDVLVKHAAALLGRTVRVLIDSAADPATPVVPEAPLRTTQTATAPPEPKTAPRRDAAPKRKITDEGLLDKAKNEPGVKKLLREFGAQVVEIRPLDPPKVSDVEPD
jgi:DNA polymerase III gamma/tau subunit